MPRRVAQQANRTAANSQRKAQYVDAAAKSKERPNLVHVRLPIRPLNVEQAKNRESEPIGHFIVMDDTLYLVLGLDRWAHLVYLSR